MTCVWHKVKIFISANRGDSMYEKVDEVKTTILESILHSDSIQTMYNKVYDILMLPMICFDVSFRIIAYRFGSDFHFESWDDIICNGQASADEIHRYNYLGLQDSIYEAGSSILVNWGRSKEHPSVNGPVMRDGELVAYCGIMVEGNELEPLFEINNAICKAVSVLWEFSMGRGDLIASALCSNHISEKFKEQFVPGHPPAYAIIMLLSHGPNVSTLQYLRGVISDSVGRFVSCVNANQIILLSYNILDRRVMLEIIDKLRLILAEYSIVCGISDFFNDILEIPEKRNQAIFTIKIGTCLHPNEKLFFYQWEYMYIMCYHAIRHYGQDICCVPEIELLAREDTENGTNYVESLYTYLMNFKRYSPAANALNIHKNTIVYRINRIKDILHNDLESTGYCNKLLLGIFMHRLLSGDSLPELEGDE